MIDPFILYAFRWQLSTLTLAPCIALYPAVRREWRNCRGLSIKDKIKRICRAMVWPSRIVWEATIFANLVGAAIFYNVDKFLIFK